MSEPHANLSIHKFNTPKPTISTIIVHTLHLSVAVDCGEMPKKKDRNILHIETDDKLHVNASWLYFSYMFIAR